MPEGLRHKGTLTIAYIDCTARRLNQAFYIYIIRIEN